MVVGDAHEFPGFLTTVLTKLFFPKAPTTFLTCFYRGERRKYAGKKSHLNWGSNLQPPDHESNTLTTEPPGRGLTSFEKLRQMVQLSCSYSASQDNNKSGLCKWLPGLQANGWLVALGFNATSTAKVISWRSMRHLCFLAFSHQY